MPRDAPRDVHRLWRFLGEHRGEMFCAACLAASLDVRGRVDRAIFAAEGNGADRRYGACSRCGKERLLCGRAGPP